MALVYRFWLGGTDIRELLAWIAVGAGLFIFVLGTVTWFYGRVRRRKTVDFSIYGYTRHPQYLRFIIRSYGVMLFAAQQPVLMRGTNPGASLPWLLTVLVVVCIALAEENKMRNEDSEWYSQYMAGAPFVSRIPEPVSAATTFPTRLVLKEERPETGKELPATFAVYATILILLSLPCVLFDGRQGIGWSGWPGCVPGAFWP